MTSVYYSEPPMISVIKRKHILFIPEFLIYHQVFVRTCPEHFLACEKPTEVLINEFHRYHKQGKENENIFFQKGKKTKQ